MLRRLSRWDQAENVIGRLGRACNFTFPGGSVIGKTEIPMKLESAVRIMAGTMVLISVALTHWVSSWWLLLGAFVGLNLIQSALTGFCPAEIIFRKLGVGKEGDSCCR